jgi:hypothetical protein
VALYTDERSAVYAFEDGRDADSNGARFGLSSRADIGRIFRERLRGRSSDSPLHEKHTLVV